MNGFLASMGIFSLIFISMGFFIAVLWTILPFAIFGTKNRLDSIIRQLELLNSKIASMENELAQLNNKTEQYNTEISSDKTEKTTDHSRYLPNKE